MSGPFANQGISVSLLTGTQAAAVTKRDMLPSRFRHP